jgi:hypothetical protein
VAHARLDGDSGAAANFDLALVEQQLDRMERPPGAARSIWPWLLIVIGLVAIVGLGIHASMAYSTIDRINVNSKIATAHPALLFQDVATNGPRVASTVEASSRSTYTRALEQFLLDGTVILVGIVLVMAGFFVRANQ